MKRVFDIVLGGVALLLLSPLLLSIAVLIRLFDGSPVLFRQNRVGKDGKLFTIYKFRTMRPSGTSGGTVDYTGGADWSKGVPDSFLFKSGTNPNTTKIGYILRRYSLDELPQFLNVVLGSMSLVGPRPEVPQIADYYNEIQRRRLLVKPGITGLAQVRGRSEIPHGDKIRYDLEYVEKQSVLLDLRILVRTAILAITGKGSV